VEDPSGLKYHTTYDYDPFGNLTKVTQGTQPNIQTRTFEYSSLSRLISATNPESGTITYTYYDSGDLESRIDQRLIGSGMTYDPLHRILTKHYTDETPDVSYEYYLSSSSSSPNIGRLNPSVRVQPQPHIIPTTISAI